MTTNANAPKRGTGRAPPPLPLVPEVFKANERLKAVSFKLYSVPEDANSPKINFEIRPINGSETLREVILFFRDVKKIKKGCNVTTSEQLDTLLRNLIQGPALNTYNRTVEELHAEEWKRLRLEAIKVAAKAKKDKKEEPLSATEVTAIRNSVNKPAITELMIQLGIQSVVVYMAPTKALAKQTAWMRRFCRKPADMTTKVFLNHLLRINDEELPCIPPKFNQSQKLSQDDIIDIILHGIPKRWAREFERSGFDPMESDLKKLMEQCERMESLDAMDGEQTEKKTEKSSNRDSARHSKKSPKKHKSSHESRSGNCVIHGKNCGHSTDECKLVLGMVNPEKRQEKKVSFKDGRRSSTNKSWSRKSDEAKDKTKKDLAAFIGKLVKKELNAVQKSDKEKRKKKDDDDEDDDDKSVNAFDLSTLDYDDMANLTINDDAKVSSQEQARRDDEEFTVSSPDSAEKDNVIDIDSDLD
jgi:hypothetical protein